MGLTGTGQARSGLKGLREADYGQQLNVSAITFEIAVTASFDGSDMQITRAVQPSQPSRRR